MTVEQQRALAMAAARKRLQDKGTVTVGAPEGLSSPGNLNLDARTVYHGKPRDEAAQDYRTENSFSIGTDQGEVLLPSVVNGRQLTQEEAIAHYEKTGENLGVFESPEAAQRYAVDLHNRQADKYRPQAPAAESVPEPSMMDRVKAKASEITAQTKQPFADSYVSEALSGVNEGLASAMSVPAMLANSALSVGPAVVNAVAGTEFKGPDYIPDPGKPALELMKMSGAIKPETDDAGKQVVRRIGKEVGASLPFGMTRPIATVATAIGSGTGAAVAQQVDPDNPWLELAGQFGGGAVTGVLGTAAARLAAKAPLPKGKAPSADELQALKTEAYQVADGLGAKYSPKAYDTLVGKTEAAVKAGNISPTRHPKAWSFVEDMRARGAKQYGQGLTLTELDQLRQEVRRDLLQSSDLSERHFGGIIIDEIDDSIAKAGAGDMLSGDSKAASEAITAARELNTRWRKTELIEDALYAADLKTAAAGSGGNINNAIRTAFKSILLNGKKRRAFSTDEINEMERIVKQGKGEDLLRLVGKLSPGGNGLMTTLGIGGTVLNPALAAAPLAGMAAKALADRGTVTKAANLRAKVAQGSGVPRNTVVAPVPDMATPLAATAMGAAANQNGKTIAPVSPKYLRPTALN